MSGLEFKQWVSIQYAIYYGVGSHKLILCCVSTDGTSLFLEEVTPTVVTNSYGALLKQFVPDRVVIDDGIRKILADNPHVKVHPRRITRDQLIDKTPEKNSDNYIPKISQLPLPFRCLHTFEKKGQWVSVILWKEECYAQGWRSVVPRRYSCS